MNASSIQVKRYNDLVGICITPEPIAAPRPFHVAFVIDTSGSMDGERLVTVQRTLTLFVEAMAETDRLTLIIYSSDARILCSGISDKAAIMRHVRGLGAIGSTNMEAGILKLLETDIASVDAVFLLTDGEVNRGIQSIAGLETLITNTLFQPHNIPVYTVGYGADHNAHLLQAIALASRSSYTYADAAEMIPTVTGSILAAMRDEVAKGVVVEWEGEGEMICWEAGASSRCKRYDVGTVIANKPQWIVLQGAGIRAVHVSSSSNVIAVDVDASGHGTTEHLDVLEQWFRVRSVKVFTEIRREGKMVALAKLQTLEDAIRESPVGSSLMALRILAEIATQREAVENPQPDASSDRLARMISNTTAFAMQRDATPLFSSETQRQVSATMVHDFFTQTQDPS